MEYQGIIFDFNGTLFFDNDKRRMRSLRSYEEKKSR